jgi:hypothetical protein
MSPPEQYGFRWNHWAIKLIAKTNTKSGEPAPVAVMPVWAFAPEGDDSDDQDVLLSSGWLWGADVLIEALRMESEQQPAPTPTVRSRFDRWIKSEGGARNRAVIRLPDRDGCYVLFAAAVPV